MFKVDNLLRLNPMRNVTRLLYEDLCLLVYTPVITIMISPDMGVCLYGYWNDGLHREYD